MLLRDCFQTSLMEMSAIQKNVVQQIQELYHSTAIVEDRASLKQVLAQAGAKFCVYILIADNNTAIIGEGTRARADVLFSNINVPFHQKAVVAALTYLLHENIVRLVIPVDTKKNALQIEKNLHKIFNFTQIRLVDKISELYQARLNHITGRWSEKEIEQFTLMYDLLGILDPSGGELNYVIKKGKLAKAEVFTPGIAEFTKLIFGKHYKNI